MNKKYELTDEVWARFVTWLEAGATFRLAASKVGIPEGTIRRWIKEGQDEYDQEGRLVREADPDKAQFASQVQTAKDEAELESLRKIRTDRKWQAHAWFLERTRPGTYGKQPTQHEHTVSGNIKIVMPDNGRD